MSMFDMVEVDGIDETLQTHAFACVGATYQIRNGLLLKERFRVTEWNDEGNPVTFERYLELIQHTGTITLNSRTEQFDVEFEGGEVQDVETTEYYEELVEDEDEDE